VVPSDRMTYRSIGRLRPEGLTRDWLLDVDELATTVIAIGAGFFFLRKYFGRV
jgi:hypothetical protein